jgi:hypothetical protein
LLQRIVEGPVRIGNQWERVATPDTDQPQR